MSEKQIEELRIKSDIFFTQILEVNEKVDKVMDYIYNDNKTGRPGLVQTVDDMKKDFDKQVASLKSDIKEINDREKTKDAYKKGQVVALGFIGAAAWALIKMLFPLIGKLF